MLASGSTQECIMINIMDDNILENDESFTLSLSTAVTGVTVAPAMADFTIMEDDGMYMCIHVCMRAI